MIAFQPNKGAELTHFSYLKRLILVFLGVLISRSMNHDLTDPFQTVICRDCLSFQSVSPFLRTKSRLTAW